MDSGVRNRKFEQVSRTEIREDFLRQKRAPIEPISDDDPERFVSMLESLKGEIPVVPGNARKDDELLKSAAGATTRAARAFGKLSSRHAAFVVYGMAAVEEKKCRASLANHTEFDQSAARAVADERIRKFGGLGLSPFFARTGAASDDLSIRAQWAESLRQFQDDIELLARGLEECRQLIRPRSKGDAWVYPALQDPRDIAARSVADVLCLFGITPKKTKDGFYARCIEYVFASMGVKGNANTYAQKLSPLPNTTKNQGKK